MEQSPSYSAARASQRDQRCSYASDHPYNLKLRHNAQPVLHLFPHTRHKFLPVRLPERKESREGIYKWNKSPKRHSHTKIHQTRFSDPDIKKRPGICWQKNVSTWKRKYRHPEQRYFHLFAVISQCPAVCFALRNVCHIISPPL